jgi:hypothetical protein
MISFATLSPTSARSTYATTMPPHQQRSSRTKLKALFHRRTRSHDPSPTPPHLPSTSSLSHTRRRSSIMSPRRNTLSRVYTLDSTYSSTSTLVGEDERGVQPQSRPLRTTSSGSEDIPERSNDGSRRQLGMIASSLVSLPLFPGVSTSLCLLHWGFLADVNLLVLVLTRL